MTKSFEQYGDDSLNIESEEVSISLTCPHKHYWLSCDVGHGDGCSHLGEGGSGQSDVYLNYVHNRKNLPAYTHYSLTHCTWQNIVVCLNQCVYFDNQPVH